MSSFLPAEAFNIVVLYERSDLLGKAMATCCHLRRELDNEFTSDLRVWRIDVATSPEFSAEASRDIAAAEIIILGVSGNQHCPPEFRRWTETATGPGGSHRAVIAIVEGADEPAAAGETWNSVLRGSATQIHPEIFVCEPLEELGGAASRRQAETLEPALAGQHADA